MSIAYSPAAQANKAASVDDRGQTELADLPPKLGKFSSFALLVNTTLISPGFVILPSVFQQAGWLTTICVILVVLCLSLVTSGLFVEALASVPNNEAFQRHLEYTGLLKHVFRHRPRFYKFFFGLYIVSVTCFSVASIVLTAQVVDYFLITFFGGTCAIVLWPSMTVTCTAEPISGAFTPFGPVVCVTLGFVFLLAFILPASYLDLRGNIWIQNGVFVTFCGVMLVWLWEFVTKDLDLDETPAVTLDQTHVLGVVLFNFSITLVLPSWVNNKSEGVSVSSSLVGSGLFSAVAYIGFGLFAAWAFPSPGYLSLLNVLQSYSDTAMITIFSIYVFYGLMVAQGIPLGSLIVRNNLLSNNACSPVWADFWAVLLPWILAMPFFTLRQLVIFISWCSLLLFGLVNFILPIYLYLHVSKERQGNQRGANTRSPLFKAADPEGGYDGRQSDAAPPQHSDAPSYHVFAGGLRERTRTIAGVLGVVMCGALCVVILLNTLFFILDPGRRL